jgi:hypothetical protein
MDENLIKKACETAKCTFPSPLVKIKISKSKFIILITILKINILIISCSSFYFIIILFITFRGYANNFSESEGQIQRLDQ